MILNLMNYTQQVFYPRFEPKKLLCRIDGPSLLLGVADGWQEPMILSLGARFHLLSILIKDSVNSDTGSLRGE